MKYLILILATVALCLQGLVLHPMLVESGRPWANAVMWWTALSLAATFIFIAKRMDDDDIFIEPDTTGMGFYDEEPFRVWPGGAAQRVEDGPPNSWMSDDYAIVFARDEEHAVEKAGHNGRHDTVPSPDRRHYPG
jgi:hypothetical protein